ncbi:MAG: HD domain-containing protein [Spirochaetes bacterium]|nr:HD domain-containing protein [Spirochaetota bacterium]
MSQPPLFRPPVKILLQILGAVVFACAAVGIVYFSRMIFQNGILLSLAASAALLIPIHFALTTLAHRIIVKSPAGHDSLRNFNRRLITILDIAKLSSFVTVHIKKICDASSSAFILRDENAPQFRVCAAEGIHHVKGRTLAAGGLASWFGTHQNSVMRRSRRFSRRAAAIRTDMDMLSAELCVPLCIGGRLIGILTVGKRHDRRPYTRSQMMFLHALSDEIAIAASNARSYNDLTRTYFETIESFASAIEAKDAYTRGHSDRVTAISLAIAQTLKLSQEHVDTLSYASMLHDIGKISIDGTVLNKPSSLTSDEMSIVRKHPAVGESIIAPIAFLSKARHVVRHHHERWDGKGYPDGIAGERIPLLSRIITVADAFDAITSSRPYRRARTHKEAQHEIIQHRGTQFDPVIVDALMKVPEQQLTTGN